MSSQLPPPGLGTSDVPTELVAELRLLLSGRTGSGEVSVAGRGSPSPCLRLPPN